MIRFSLPLFLLNSSIVVVGVVFKILSVPALVGAFLLGLVLTRPLLLSYKTGDPRYAVMYGAGLGLGISIMFVAFQPAGSVLLLALCWSASAMSAEFLLLLLFRRRFLEFIGS